MAAYKVRGLSIRRCLTVLLPGAMLFAAAPVLADPVGECQAITSSQVETGQCLQDTLGTAQYVMGVELEQAQQYADSIDQVTGRPGARAALDQSQADWETFLGSNCAVRSAFAAGGSGSGQFQIGCAIDMTRARTQELSALANGG
jgi:uncharacterized protein YecT (DUF1311 family)